MSVYYCEMCNRSGVKTPSTGCSGEAGNMWLCDAHGGWGTHDERTLQEDATWNAALEAAADYLKSIGEARAAIRISSLKRGQS